jgi:hypothetical protein
MATKDILVELSAVLAETVGIIRQLIAANAEQSGEIATLKVELDGKVAEIATLVADETTNTEAATSLLSELKLLKDEAAAAIGQPVVV